MSDPAATTITLTVPADKKALLDDTTSQATTLLESSNPADKEQGLQLLEGSLLLLNEEEASGTPVADSGSLRNTLTDGFLTVLAGEKSDPGFVPTEESVNRNSQILEALTAVPTEVTDSQVTNILDAVTQVIDDAKQVSAMSTSTVPLSTATTVIASLDNLGRAGTGGQAGQQDTAVLNNIAAAAQSIGSVVLKNTVPGEQPATITSASGAVSVSVANLDPAVLIETIEVGEARVHVPSNELESFGIVGSLISFGATTTEGIPSGFSTSQSILLVEAIDPDTGAVQRVENLETPVLLQTPIDDVEFKVNDAAACIFRSPGFGKSAWERNFCTSLPNPQPRGVTVRWVANYKLTDGNILAGAWEVSSPDALDGCTESSRLLETASDPYYAITGYHIIEGDCKIVDPGNSYGCYWDNSAQAFKGGSCIFDTNQECKCSHFTEFAVRVGPAPLITYTGSELLEAEGSVTNLVLIVAVLILVLSLLAAGVAFYWNYLKRRNLMSRLQSPNCGFETIHGTWTWSWDVDVSNPSAPRGSAPALAAAIGLPWCRLAVAIPEANALGFGHRQGDTSVMSSDAEWRQRAIGTAMVHAWLSLTGTMSTGELARQAASANSLFNGCHVLGFAALVARFRAMLAPGANSLMSSGWLSRAHTWRLVFSQGCGGLWSTPAQAEAVAQALGAVPMAPFSNIPATGMVSDEVRLLSSCFHVT